MKLFFALVLSCISAAIAETGTGEVVFVTGASSGIGLEVSKYLAGQGYKIVLTARRTSKLEAAVKEITKADGTAIALALDVSDEMATVDAILKAEAKFGPINHFVLNAGVLSSEDHGLDVYPMDSVKKMFDVNVIGVLKGFKHGLQALRRAEGKRSITLVSSVAGTMNRWFFGDMAKAAGADFTGFAPYAMTKAAVDMLTRAASYYKHEGIRVYNIKPAVFDSEMARGAAANAGVSIDEISGGFNPAFPGIAGHPREIARALEHFMDDSTHYLPGQNVCIDNDVTADAQEQYGTIETPDQTTFALSRSSWRGLDGGEYKCSTKRTCDRLAELAKKAKAEL